MVNEFENMVLAAGKTKTYLDEFAKDFTDLKLANYLQNTFSNYHILNYYIISGDFGRSESLTVNMYAFTEKILISITHREHKMQDTLVVNNSFQRFHISEIESVSNEHWYNSLFENGKFTHKVILKMRNDEQLTIETKNKHSAFVLKFINALNKVIANSEFARERDTKYADVEIDTENYEE
ncbi:hypothetical protein QFZ81_003995 [Paenibacillus sp. V4I9]|uniref:hypothetical protein n=1 Tax=Paenibacillus sp. V4I9 TaxID=3042308 RepID=UPI002786CDC7|nr:hypothetical protein [Paenibacillus sp. V4I9]MDQ0888907.1 hypothetical protein [Paenibacillus sp. V4I9]